MPVAAQRYAPRARLATLLDHPQNPRRGDDNAVAQSLDSNGWYGAIVAQQSTGFILAGHTRRRTLVAKGETTAPVIWLDVDDATALRILLADNRTAELATWDEAALLTMLNELGPVDMESVGFSGEDLATIMRRVDVANGSVDAHAEWAAAGMPDYESEDHMGAYRTVVHFATDEDADAFFAMISRERARHFWWPQSDGRTDGLIDSRVAVEDVA